MNVRFFAGTKQQYLNLAKHNPLALYFCADTCELFWGDRCLSDGARVVPTYDDLPAVAEAADGIIYYVANTRNGYVLAADRANWTQVIYAPGNGNGQDVDLSSYYTKDETEAAISAVIATIELPDVSGFLKEIPAEYVTEAELEARGYLTEHQDISHKADLVHNHDELYDVKGAADAVKNELLNGAGEAFDTLKELGALIDDNKDAIDALELIATGKADKEHTHDQYLTEHQSLDDYAKIDYVNKTTVAKKYEVLPVDGMLVSYRENEVRINTEHVVPVKQTVGETGNPNMFYVTFRAYAPEGATGVIESDGSQTDAEPTALGKDAFGRSYATIWAAVANYNGTAWTKWGDSSTLNKYLGFYYTFKWFKEDQLIGTDKVRVILTNDACHDDLVPDAVARRIDEKVKAIEVPEYDLSKYALKSEVPSIVGLASEQYVDDKFAALEIPEVDLSEYAKLSDIPSHDGLATETFVNEAIAAIESPSIEGLASEQFVAEAIAAIELPVVPESISAFANDVGYITEHQDLSHLAEKEHAHDEYAVKEHVHEQYLTEHQDLSAYALKSEIPSVDGLASEIYVDEKIATIEIPEVDLSDYAKLSDIPSHEGLATEAFVKNAIAEAELNDKDVDLTGYVTKDELSVVEAKIPSVEGLASVEYVGNVISNLEIPEVPENISAFNNDVGYITEHQSLEGYAKVEDIPDVANFATKDELPSIDGLATEDYVTNAINAIPEVDLSEYAKVDDIPTDYLVEADLEGYSKFSGSYDDLTNKPEIPSIAGLATEEFVAEAIADIEFPEVDLSDYATKAEIPSLDGYAKLTDIPDVSSFITEVPEEYVTETELSAKGFITEHQDISHLATKEEIPDVSGFISEIPDNYITDEELNSRGYLTEHQDISGKADKEHTHSYNELTDRPEIPSIAGLATEQFVQDEIAKIDIPEVDTSNLVSTTTFNEALAAKADEVPFKADKFVTISVGNFVVGESVKGLTVAQILAKLLGLSDGAVDPDEPETPEVPQGIIETIIAGQLPMYQVNTEGQLEEVPYNYISLTSEQSVKEPTSAGFYQILDSSTGAAIESGYQQLSAYNEDMPYLIALPSEIDFNTHITVQKFDDGFTQQWVSETLDLTNDIEEIQAVFDEIGQTLPTAPEGYTLWADLGRGSDTSAYRLIITE